MSNESQQDNSAASQNSATRRGVLAGAGLAGVAGVISACSFGSSGSSAGSAYGSGSGAGASAPSAAPSGSGMGGGSANGGSASGGASLASTSEIPVGGGKVFASQKVVVTQPEAGTFKAFSAICTHQQCSVDKVANGTISCPCHGATFSAKDGSVTGGPAPSPLPPANITVTGKEITLG